VVFFQTIFSVPIIFLWAYPMEVILETYYTSKRNKPCCHETLSGIGPIRATRDKINIPIKCLMHL
jgi:hypothetical protein